MITEEQFKEAAQSIGCEVAAVKAVNDVESSGNGFVSAGRPKILFEGHIFWKQLQLVGIDPYSLLIGPGNENILYPHWDTALVKPFYKQDQYQRLEKAKSIHLEAALKSASWGAFQIMGFKHKACGYSTVEQFCMAQIDEYLQLQAFCNYLRSTKLHLKLKALDWKGFARGYNGPDYAKNQYDIKLHRAYILHLDAKP